MTRWPAKHRARPEVASGTGVACLDSDGKTPRRYVGGAYRGDMGGLSGHPAPYHSAPGLLLPECYQPMKGQPHDSAIQPSCDDNPRPMGQADRNDPRATPRHRAGDQRRLACPSVGPMSTASLCAIKHPRTRGRRSISALHAMTMWSWTAGTGNSRYAAKNWAIEPLVQGRRSTGRSDGGRDRKWPASEPAASGRRELVSKVDPAGSRDSEFADHAAIAGWRGKQLGGRQNGYQTTFPIT